jgi:hypothetical protein
MLRVVFDPRIKISVTVLDKHIFALSASDSWSESALHPPPDLALLYHLETIAEKLFKKYQHVILKYAAIYNASFLE